MDQNDQMTFFYEIFDASLPRLGPGDPHLTKRALDVILSEYHQQTDARDAADLKVLDMGCGNGAATLELAKHVGGTIVAVDNHQPFLDELKRRAQAQQVDGKIKLFLGDMKHLELDDGSFDLVWSEGALNIVGMREGLMAAHRLVAPGGLLGISEIAWLKPDPPEECQRHFDGVLPLMTDIAATLTLMKDCSYEILAHFIFPESAWWKWFYEPLEDRLQVLREKYDAESEKLEMIESIQREIDIYRKYSSYYGYVFYLMKRL